METRVLRYFLAIAAEGSISRAAAVLHVTQPTLSRQLMDLEERLGEKLFIRESHSVRLTEKGMLLRERAQDILAMIERTEGEIRVKPHEIGGDIHIGCGETYALQDVANVAKSLQQEFPAIHFHLYSGNEQDVTEKLDKGLLDFGVLIEPANLSKYEALPLPLRDLWGVIMRADAPLAAKPHVTSADLIDLPLICSRQALDAQVSRNDFLDWFGEHADSLKLVCSYNLLYNATIMVKAGMGYALSLDRLVDTREGSELCFRPLEPRLESGLNIVWKTQRLRSAAAELFLQRLRTAFA